MNVKDVIKILKALENANGNLEVKVALTSDEVRTIENIIVEGNEEEGYEIVIDI